MGYAEGINAIENAPTADVIEVRHDFNVGDFCLYGFADGNKSLAIVEIVKILDDERGIAELKFHKVIKDNTGNGYFHYLFKSGHTMNGSFEYLKNITPKVDGEMDEVHCTDCKHFVGCERTSHGKCDLYERDKK